MRLDHLLSRERTKKETDSFIPGRYTEKSVWSTKVLKAEEAKNPRSEMQSGRMTVYFLTLYRFQGSRERNLICTLKTAQPDGKTSCSSCFSQSLVGGEYRDRTGDLLLARQALSQLS